MTPQNEKPPVRLVLVEVQYLDHDGKTIVDIEYDKMTARQCRVVAHEAGNYELQPDDGPYRLRNVRIKKDGGRIFQMVPTTH